MTCSDPTDLPVLGQPRPTREPATDADGWTRRTTMDEPRLSELVELYEELGFEVQVRSLTTADTGPGCAECLLADRDRYRTIYTRPRPSPDEPE